MITIESLKELINKSSDKISSLEEQIFSLEKDIEFEKAKIAVCEEMIANEENESEQEVIDSYEDNAEQEQPFEQAESVDESI